MTRLRAIRRRAVILAFAASLVGLGSGVAAARWVGRAADGAAAEALVATGRDLSACHLDPSRWASDQEPRAFAYDGVTLQSANPAAPAYAGPRALALDAPWIRSAPSPLGGATIALRVQSSGPCAVLQRRWPRRARADEILGVAVVALAIGFAATSLMGIVLVVRPLLRATARVADSARRVGEADGYQRPDELESEELERIVDALAVSHERVLSSDARARDRMRALERHLAEIAHDFRTPLTALQLSVEAALDATSDPAVHAPLLVAMQESVYLAGLTENLRLAARHREIGSYGGDAWLIDLRDVVERVATRAAILARRKAMRFEVAIGEAPLPARCAPLAIERAISNVLENAVVHGSANGSVRVSLASEGAQFVLRIEGDGAAERSARAGSGLGMQITRGVCAEACWELTLAPLEAGGARVEIRGPSEAGAKSS